MPGDNGTSRTLLAGQTLPLPVQQLKRIAKPSSIQATVSTLNRNLPSLTFASHFIMNGGNILTLQKILGHTSLAMTMRYAHVSSDHLQDAVRFGPGF